MPARPPPRRRAQQLSPEPTRPPDALGAAGQVGTGTLTVGLASLDRQHSSAKGTPTVMSTSQFAVIVGIALGVVAVFAGFVSFVIVLLFAAAGLVVGRVLEGKLDLRLLVGRSTERR